MKNFHTISYVLHGSTHKLDDNNELSEIQHSWLRTDTVDYWRHYRMCTPIIPIAKLNPDSSWLTVGDGGFGLDSIRLKSFEPSITVLPTDLSTPLLEKAKQLGLIENYKMENAEELSFADNSFDFSFCKESMHHFPRPFIAIYEMMRVARKGVILIEPFDSEQKTIYLKLFSVMKNILKKLTGKKIIHHDSFRFEESGNYVYTISEREIEKVAIGLQLPMIGFYSFNDFYLKGVEFEEAMQASPLFRKIKFKIHLQNFLCSIGLSTFNQIVAILFKEIPSEALINSLRKVGVRLVKLPENPYLKDAMKKIRSELE